MTASNFSWDRLRTKLLRKLWANGHIAEIIAKMLGAPSSLAIMQKARREGLGRRMRLKSGRLTSRIETVYKEKQKVMPSGKIQKERKCLSCLKMFMSRWNGNRICPECSGHHDEYAENMTDSHAVNLLSSLEGVPKSSEG